MVMLFVDSRFRSSSFRSESDRLGNGAEIDTRVSASEGAGWLNGFIVLLYNNKNLVVFGLVIVGGGGGGAGIVIVIRSGDGDGVFRFVENLKLALV
jgi:hypothetical protein